MSRKLFSVFFLGLFFLRHWFVRLWKVITRPNQLKLFKRNFLDDNLIEFKEEEYEVLRKLSHCILCNRCKYYNPFINSALAGFGLTPADIPAVLTRSQSDFVLIENLAESMARLNLDEIFCPYGVPFREGVELIINLNQRLQKERDIYEGEK